MKEQIYLHVEVASPYWDKEADKAARKELARKMKARKVAFACLGKALVETGTIIVKHPDGTRAVFKSASAKPKKPQTITIDLSDL